MISCETGVAFKQATNRRQSKVQTGKGRNLMPKAEANLRKEYWNANKQLQANVSYSIHGTEALTVSKARGHFEILLAKSSEQDKVRHQVVMIFAPKGLRIKRWRNLHSVTRA